MSATLEALPTLFVDRLEFSYIQPGSQEELRDEYISSVHVFAFDTQGRLLTIFNENQRGLDIPGGHREQGETWRQAVSREVFEETGYVLKDITPVALVRESVLKDSKYFGKEMLMVAASVASDVPYFQTEHISQFTEPNNFLYGYNFDKRDFMGNMLQVAMERLHISPATNDVDKESVIWIDQMYKDEMLAYFSEAQEPFSIGFLDAREIAKQLESIKDSPAVYLNAQRKLVYGRDGQVVRPNLMETERMLKFLTAYNFKILMVVKDGPAVYIKIDPNGNTFQYSPDQMPTMAGLSSANSFYLDNPVKSSDERITLVPKVPRILNIGSGSDVSRQFQDVVNVDVSAVGRPTVVADMEHLPFRDGIFSAVMASHVLEHTPAEHAGDVIEEWKRVVHEEGVLRIAVPDADITLKELIDKKTSKGIDSFSVESGSPPLTQVVGLGGDVSSTDSRWRHHALYSGALLEQFLHEHGFDVVRTYPKESSISDLLGIKTDEINRYSLRLEAKRGYTPHESAQTISTAEFQRRLTQFVEGRVDFPPLSIIVPVKNEEKLLPRFFEMLVQSSKWLQFIPNFEILFVLNGCTDNSCALIEEFIASQKQLPVRIVQSEQEGIVQAFVEGIDARSFDGIICKFDADAVSEDSFAIALLYMELLQNDQRHAVYAETVPLDKSMNLWTIGEHKQHFRSKRNYLHGRLSMYKHNPFQLFNKKRIIDSGVVVEDIILSCLYIYFYGFNSVGAAPGAVVATETPDTIETHILERLRFKEEWKRVLKAFPLIETLRLALDRNTVRPADPREQPIFDTYSRFVSAVDAFSVLPECEIGRLTQQHAWFSRRDK